MASLEKVNISPGKIGDYEIEKFEITEYQAKMHSLRCAINFHRGEVPVVAGTYTRLVYKDMIWMSDTPQEVETHRKFYEKAEGHVLITGLGIGMIAQALARKPNVARVHVVEKSLEVISLVGPAMSRIGKIAISHGDAFMARPPLPPDGRYDWAWHDIWPSISRDNLPDMERLTRRYSKWVKHQMCWGRRELTRQMQYSIKGRR